MISQFNYDYNAIGEITAWTQNHSGLSEAEKYTFGYDRMSQLTSGIKRSVVSGTSAKGWFFRYDAAGNREVEQEDESLRSSQYNKLNQLTAQSAEGVMTFSGSVSKPSVVKVGGRYASIDENWNWQGTAAVTSGSNAISVTATDASNHTTSKTINITLASGTSGSFSYDASGNMTSNETNHYEWDALERLVRIWYGTTGTSASTEMTYDGLDRRISITERNSGGVITSVKQFVWDGLQLCEERDLSNVVTRRFYPQGEQIGGVNYYFIRDHLESVREVTDSNGVIRAQYDYNLYGKYSKLSGALDSNFGYTGHYQHLTSGLVFAPYRVYDSNFGRWISRDPIGEKGGLNMYGYVGNDPIRWRDPEGLIFGEGMFVGAVVGGFANIIATTLSDSWHCHNTDGGSVAAAFISGAAFGGALGATMTGDIGGMALLSMASAGSLSTLFQGGLDAVFHSGNSNGCTQ